MRTTPLPPVPSCLTHGELRNGAFIIPRKGGLSLRVVASDGTDWEACGFRQPVFEHVSVSTGIRCPTWEEMDWVKSLWWRDDETVIQYHVPRSSHVNFHPFCLHMWKPVGIVLPTPPTATVGPIGASL